jgi:hypothetical protein
MVTYWNKHGRVGVANNSAYYVSHSGELFLQQMDPPILSFEFRVSTWTWAEQISLQ